MTEKQHIKVLLAAIENYLNMLEKYFINDDKIIAT